MNPTTLSAHQLMELGAHAIHELALRAAGTLTAYRLLLGRCLLALDRSTHYLEYGCCNSIHYATSVLGMEAEPARQYRRVARQLEELPRLQSLAEQGQISWSKLREVARVATADSEAFWIEMCRDYPYREVERLVRKAQTSGVGEPSQSELRIFLTPEGMQLLERAFQSVSLEAGRMLSPVEAIEHLAAEYLARRPLDVDVLEAVREQAARDEAASQERDAELIEAVECSARNMAPWTLARAVALEGCPDNAEVQIAVADEPHWGNRRLRHNAENRSTTPAQRREILRRDGYRCQTPGCCHQLFLEVHHIVYYAGGGETMPDNLVVLCSACHRNLHRGGLRIEGTVSEGLRFYDREGRDLCYQARLEVAHWLDFNIGWRGEASDSYSFAVAGGGLCTTVETTHSVLDT